MFAHVIVVPEVQQNHNDARRSAVERPEPCARPALKHGRAAPKIAPKNRPAAASRQLQRKWIIESIGHPPRLDAHAGCSDLTAENEFARSAKRFRLLLASALSIFIFAFQGSIEAAQSTFDCTDVNGMLFLRRNPKVRCAVQDALYVRMIATTVAGMISSCILLPVVSIITLRSRWCREVYIHDSMAYSQIFGFRCTPKRALCGSWSRGHSHSRIQGVSCSVCIDVCVAHLLHLRHHQNAANGQLASESS